MRKIESITLGFSIASFVLVFLLGSQGVLLKPLFSADVTENKENNETTISIKNAGFAQAKNSVAQIILPTSPTLIKNNCYEGTIFTNESKIITIEFSRFSTSVNCELIFDKLSKWNIEGIIVTADDSQGYTWSPFADINFKLIVFQIIAYAVLGTVITATSGSVVLSYQRRIRKRKNETSLSRENEIIADIKTAQEELDSLEMNLDAIKDISLAQHTKKRMTVLDNRIRELTGDLDQIRGKRTTEGKLENFVGEFFINWAELEQQLVRLTEKFEINPIRLGTSSLTRELARKEVLQREFIDKFDRVRKFRNGLVHGNIVPTRNELSENITAVKKLLEELKPINSN